MKIRSGFVSNSSSSSFYIQKPDRHLTLEEISSYYNISPDLSEDERAWLSMCIWQILKSQEKCGTESDDWWEEATDHSDPGGLDYYLSEDHIEWMQGSDYYRKPPEYWEQAKKLKEDPSRLLSFSVDTNGGDSFEDLGFKIPFSVAYDLRRDADNAFSDVSKALGISE